MPLPNTKAIPTGWSKHHAPVAKGGMNAKCEIRDPAAATSTWDDDTESQVLTPADPVYTGVCRIQELNDAHEGTQADQQVTSRTYLVQLEFDAEQVEQGWHVKVTECPNDTHLVTRTVDRPLVIDDVQSGSERFTRDVVATINLD